MRAHARTNALSHTLTQILTAHSGRGCNLGAGGWCAVGAWLAGATLLSSLNGFDLAPLRAGGLTQLRMVGMEGLPIAVAVAGLLELSAVTLKSVNFRRRSHTHT